MADTLPEFREGDEPPGASYFNELRKLIYRALRIQVGDGLVVSQGSDGTVIDTVSEPPETDDDPCQNEERDLVFYTPTAHRRGNYLVLPKKKAHFSRGGKLLGLCEMSTEEVYICCTSSSSSSSTSTDDCVPCGAILCPPCLCGDGGGPRNYLATVSGFTSYCDENVALANCCGCDGFNGHYWLHSTAAEGLCYGNECCYWAYYAVEGDANLPSGGQVFPHDGGNQPSLFYDPVAGEFVFTLGGGASRLGASGGRWALRAKPRNHRGLVAGVDYFECCGTLENPYVTNTLPFAGRIINLRNCGDLPGPVTISWVAGPGLFPGP